MEGFKIGLPVVVHLKETNVYRAAVIKEISAEGMCDVIIHDGRVYTTAVIPISHISTFKEFEIKPKENEP